MKKKYWILKWNAGKKKVRSSRLFATFLAESLPFETYGYKKVKDFKKIRKGHRVFCYQKDKKAIVGTCIVEKGEGKNIIIDGPCVVLKREIWPLAQEISKWTNDTLRKINLKETITELSREEAEALFGECRSKS